MLFPHIDPVIFHLGPLQVRWYGLMYVLGFLATLLLVRHQIKKYDLRDLDRNYENLNIILILSMIVGGRLGYVLFYNFSYFLQHPLEIPATWHGGMSFHGGLIGLLLGGWLFCRRHQLDFLQAADIYVVTIPVGLGLGRIGNFINAELFGRVTGVSWGMVFPGGGPLPRHPSQLYECLFEGILLFIILWTIKDRMRQLRPSGIMLSLFLVLYGLFRFLAELFREPDPQVGFVAGILTMGQMLSILMICAGVLLILARKKGSV